MKKITLYIISLMVVLFSSISSAQVVSVVYVNGINNDEDLVADTLQLIKKGYESNLKTTYPTTTFKFEYVHNWSFGNYSSFIEAFD